MCLSSTRKNTPSSYTQLDPCANTCVFATYASVLIIYEHILTAEQEYRMIWKRKFSVPCALFLVNWYTLLLVAIFNILSYMIWWQDNLVSLSYQLPNSVHD